MTYENNEEMFIRNHNLIYPFIYGNDLEVRECYGLVADLLTKAVLVSFETGACLETTFETMANECKANHNLEELYPINL